MATDAKETQQIVQALRDRGLEPDGLSPIGVRPSSCGDTWERSGNGATSSGWMPGIESPHRTAGTCWAGSGWYFGR